MSIHMAADIDCYRESGYVGRVGIDIYCQSCNPATKSCRADPKIIDLFEHL